MAAQFLNSRRDHGLLGLPYDGASEGNKPFLMYIFKIIVLPLSKLIFGQKYSYEFLSGQPQKLPFTI